MSFALGGDTPPLGRAADLSDAELVATLPSIPWGTAVPVRTPAAHGLGCRFCIARHGLRASDVEKLPQDREAWEAHMREHHAGVLA